MRRLRIAVFWGLIFLVSAASCLIPRGERSGFPAEAWGTGTFQQEAEEWLREGFPFRQQLAEMRSGLELLQGRREVNGVLIGKSRLLEKTPPLNSEGLAGQAEALNRFARRYPKMEVSLMLVPTASAFYQGDVSLYADTANQSRYIQECASFLHRVNMVDAYGVMSAASGDSLYYRTDPRWNSYGAYTGYTSLAKTLGFRAVSPEQFNIEYPVSDFLGSLYYRAAWGKQFAEPIALYSYAEYEPVVDVERCFLAKTETYRSIFFREELEGADPLRVYLGEDCPVVRIRTNRDNGKRLLVFSEGTADGMMQFLPLHYEEIALVDFSQLGEKRWTDYLKPGDYAQALFVYQTVSFGEVDLAGML